MLFVGDRSERCSSRPIHRRLAVERELHRVVGFRSQQTIDVLVGLQRLTVYCKYVLAHGSVDSDFSQRRAIDFFFVHAFEDLGNSIEPDFVVYVEPRSRQRDPRPGRNLKIPALNVSVLHGELRDHLAYYVVEIGTMGYVLQQWLVLLAQSNPVVAMHVRYVEIVAIASPDFVEDLLPFLRRHAVVHKPANRHRFLVAIALRGRVQHAETRTLSYQQL